MSDINNTSDTNDLQKERQFMMWNYSQLADFIVKDLNEGGRTRYTVYNRDNVATFLSDPIRYAKDLQGVSSYIYNNSSHYRRLINYFANLPTLDHYVELRGLLTPQDIDYDKILEGYMQAVNKVESMKIPYEFGKALKTAWKIGTFYGYEVKGSDDSYFIYELPYEHCQISGITEGVYTFSFNMSYFDGNDAELERFPDEFTSMFREYQSTGLEWQEVNPENSICIKINDEFYYDLPPFVGLFVDIFDIEEYKTMEKVNAVLENYKFIVQKIPMRKDSLVNNDFLVDLKTVSVFHGKTAQVVPEEVGVISTPFDIDTIEFSKDRTNRDGVREAERGLYSAGGISQSLFNPEKPTQGTLQRSINVDESDVFKVLRQIENQINFKIKQVIGNDVNVGISILDNTVFNREDNTNLLLKGAQASLPVKLKLLASLGMSPSAGVSMNILEDKILQLTDHFVPLKSSHTQSSSSEGGRPEMDDSELTDGGEEQRDRGDNEGRD